MTKASDNAYPSVLITEGTEPSAPAAGKQRVYIDSTTHHLKRTDSSGTDVDLETNQSSGSVATDAIWDTAGDLAVGTGANTAAKLVIGAAGATLGRINGALAYNAGTSFPSAAAADFYYRTDLKMAFRYDGTRWVSDKLFHFLPYYEAAQPLSASGQLNRWPTNQNLGTDIWLVDCLTTFFVSSGGTALAAGHKWVCLVQKTDTSDASTTLITVNIDSGASATHRQDAQAIGALLGTSATYPILKGVWTKTGSPGNLRAYTDVTYRIVST